MNKIFLDMDGTIAKFNVRNALERFAVEKGFFANLGAYKGIETINEMVKNGNVYIISASPNMYADLDKMTWLKKYLPNLARSSKIVIQIPSNRSKRRNVTTDTADIK